MSITTLEYETSQDTTRREIRVWRCTPRTRSWFWWFMQTLCLWTCKIIYRLKMYGVEHIPTTGGVLIASSHQSYLDPILVGVCPRRPLAFLANAYLFKNPFFGWLIRCLNAFPIEQGKGDRAAVTEAIARLKEGYVLSIFPEGHRSPDGELKPLERGFALVARKAGVPVVPAAIDGAYQAWPRRRKFPGIHPVHVIFGKPIDVREMSAQEIVDAVGQALQELTIELRKRRETSGWPEWYAAHGRKMAGTAEPVPEGDDDA